MRNYLTCWLGYLTGFVTVRAIQEYSGHGMKEAQEKFRTEVGEYVATALRRQLHDEGYLSKQEAEDLRHFRTLQAAELAEALADRLHDNCGAVNTGHSAITVTQESLTTELAAIFTTRTTG